MTLNVIKKLVIRLSYDDADFFFNTSYLKGTFLDLTHLPNFFLSNFIFYLFQCCLLMMVTMLFIRATVVLLTWYFRTSAERAKYCSPAVSLLTVVRCFTDSLIHFTERTTPISSHINVSAFLRDWSFTATKLDFTWDFIFFFRENLAKSREIYIQEKRQMDDQRRITILRN